MEIAALVPVKGFHVAKARLAPVLADDDRRRVASFLARGVVEALRPVPTFVACDDDVVADWADSLGVGVLWGPGLGLNGAIDVGVETLAGKGFDHVLISHGDLPDPRALASVPIADTVVVVPDRRRDGTNVLCRPTAFELPAQYGAGSFHRHVESATDAGYRVSVRIDPALSIDIDTIDDCRHPVAAAALRHVLGAATPT